MKQTLYRLADILRDEIVCHEKLLKLAYRKERVIINNDVEELKAITQEEEAGINSIRLYEEDRDEAVKKLAKHFKVSGKTFTLGALIEKLDNNIALEFQMIHTEITELLRKLKRMNERNSRLIKTSLDLVSYSMNLYVSLNQGPKTYGNQGQVAKGSKGSSLVFDKTV